MKKIIIPFLFLAAISSTASAQLWNRGSKNDIIMLRDGSSVEAKIQQISGKSVKFKNETSGVKLDELPVTEIYMIKYAKRGNVFFTKEGNRKTGEVNEADSRATLIYTTDYREIPAYDLEFDVDKIIYRSQKADKKNPQPARHVLGLFQVFMIIYPDGTSEIVTELDKVPSYTEPEQQTAAARQEELLKVVFHAVRQGETLQAIADRYDVTPEQIVEWNELPATTKAASRLKPGQQLMIYVKNIE